MELTKHITTKISENKINPHLHITDALLQARKQFLVQGLDSTALFLLRTLEQSSFGLGFRLLRMFQNKNHENTSYFGERVSGRSAVAQKFSIWGSFGWKILPSRGAA